jgi:Circularly permutated YpsA SLOG family
MQPTQQGNFAAESRLRGAVRTGPGLSVLTGGQTGVDTHAALAALRAGLQVHLIFPAGYRQEDGPLTASRRRRLAGAGLHELGSASFRYRTWTCVYLADAVILLDPAGGSGCRETVRAARKLGRPLLIPEPAQVSTGQLSTGQLSAGQLSTGQLSAGQLSAGQLSADQTADWLAAAGARVLMVAGCRASVLASKGKGRGLRADLTVIMAGARQQHERLLGKDADERVDPS